MSTITLKQAYFTEKGFLPQQWEGLNSTNDIICLLGGAFSGKTMTGDFFCMKKIQEGCRYGIWVEPTHSDISTYLYLDHINYWWQALFPGEYNAGKKLYTTVTGQVIQLVSGEKPERMEGRHPEFIVLNEGGMLRRSVWDTALERIGTTDGQILICTTPYNKNWLYDITEGADKEKIQPHVIKLRSLDNKYEYTDAKIAKMKKKLTKYQFARKYEGEWADPEGLVFNWPDTQLTDHVPSYVKMMEYWCGLDFGFVHPSVCILFGVDSSGGVWVLDEAYNTQMTAAQFADEAIKPMFRRNRIRSYKAVAIYCDDSRPDSIKDLCNKGLKAMPAGKGKILDGINKGKMLIEDYKAHVIEPRCENLLREAWTYVYDEKTGEPKKEKGDDSQDAFRYGALNSETHIHRRARTNTIRTTKRQSIIPEGY